MDYLGLIGIFLVLIGGLGFIYVLVSETGE